MRKSRIRRVSDAVRQNRFELAMLEPRMLLSGSTLQANLSAPQLAYTPLPQHSMAVQSVPPKQSGDGPLFALVVPTLSSRPGAAATIYLDFNGDNYNGYWGDQASGFLPGITPAYDSDGNPTSFSNDELTQIQEIWTRVSEKYSPFDVNVTTVDPGTLADRVAERVVIGGNGAWLGESAGGVAWLDSYSRADLPNTVWAFSDNLGTPKSVAEASAHEAGHGFGLEHQSTYDADGKKLEEYNPGNTEIAPIMGVSYYAARGLWFKGPNSISSTTIQDDLAVITKSANAFTYRQDDHGNTLLDSTALTADTLNKVHATGVIETNSDVDAFSFVTGAGNVNLTITVGTGAMLNTAISLYDGGGNLVITLSPTNTFGANLNINLTAGKYTLMVSGDGTYGDLGQYTLNGQLISLGASIGDRVFNDLNFNGIQDAGEPGLADIPVRLFKASDNSLVASTVTNSNGIYSLLAPATGDYYVKVINPSQYVFSPAKQGNNDTLDSDFNTAGRSTTVTIATLNDQITTIDAGLMRPSIGIADTQVVEGNTGITNMVFTVTLRSASLTTLDVPYTTSAGTATAGTDFTQVSGVLHFAPGVLVQTFIVPVIGDTTIENNETLDATITAPAGLTFTQTTAVGTIIDDDLPTVTISSPSVLEGNIGTVPMVFTFSLSVPSPKTITMNYATTDGTAIAGQDYIASTGSLTFTPGQTTKTITVLANGDTMVEGNETFSISLTNPVNVLVGVGGGIGTILTDDFPTLSMNDATITEPVVGQADAIFTLTMSTPVASPVTVDFSTVTGTALAGSDFVARTGTFTMQANQVSAILRIPVNSDFEQEDAENFTLSLSNPVGTVLANTTATGTIINQAVNSFTFDLKHPLRYVDFIGNTVTVMLRGPGTGTAGFTGASGNDAKVIQLDGTTAASQLIIKTSGLQTSLVNLNVNGSIGVIDGKMLNLLGNLNVTGAMKKLRLNFLGSGNLVNVGTDAASGIAGLSVVFGRVINAKLISGIPISSLKALNWNDADALPDITAPNLGNLAISGDFSADVSTTGNVGKLTVSGALVDSIVRADGNITSVQAATMSGSTIFAGVQAAVSTLPTIATDFANTTSSIGKVLVKSKAAGAFSNTLIAAPRMGTAQLGSVNTTVGTFGVATGEFSSIKGKTEAGAFNLTNPVTPGDILLQGGFVVRVIPAF